MSQAVAVITEPDRASVVLDPIRLKLLTELVQPDSAAGLSRRLGVPRQKLNYHLRLLEDQGLVELVEERRKRNCIERVVRATARSLLISPSALGELGADPGQIEDRSSSAYLVAMAARTIREVGQLRDGADQAGKKLATLTLEAEIRFATPSAQQQFAEELTREFARLAARYHDEHAAEGRRFRCLGTVYPAPKEEP
jgi:DNA-binding transcriptional ArsR family regulator